MKITLRQKLILLTVSLVVFVTIVAAILSSVEIQKHYKARIKQQLEMQLYELEYLLGNSDLVDENNRYTKLNGYARQVNLRITFIDSLGAVLYDSNVPQDSIAFLSNHLFRPEIQMALQKTSGYDLRGSVSIPETMLYAAKVFNPDSAGSTSLINNIYFIRLAMPLREIKQAINALLWKIAGGSLISLLLFTLASYYFANRLTYPIHKLAEIAESIKKGNLDAHFEHNSQDEIGDLAELLNEILDKLRSDLVQLRKLEKMRSQFLGNVSHELRTPIFAVQGYLETLLQSQECDVKMQRKFIKKAYRQAVRLNNLFTDLIDISRIESGEMKMIFRNFNLHKWLNSIVNDLQETGDDHNVSLVFANKNEEKLYVLGDKNRLKQVIINLVMNAIKYNVPYGKVEVGAREGGDKVTIYVADSGRGIAREHINRIFERFYRVDKERSRNMGGTGLGLAIAKHIVEAHHSEIKVESEENKGSIFSFTLDKAIADVS